jgi:hypothetical protein
MYKETGSATTFTSKHKDTIFDITLYRRRLVKLLYYERGDFCCKAATLFKERQVQSEQLIEDAFNKTKFSHYPAQYKETSSDIKYTKRNLV